MSLYLTATFTSVTQDRNGMRTATDSTIVPGCVFAPGSSAENVNAEDQVTENGTLYCPYGTDPTAYEQVTLPGDSVPWEIQGSPNNWANPFTSTLAGTAISLRRVIG